MSIFCTLQAENLSAQLSRAKIDVGENDLSGWPNLIEGLTNSESLLTNSERRTLTLFFGSANIQINSIANLRTSNIVFELYELFSIKINGNFYVYHSRDGNNITINRIDSKVYDDFMLGQRYTDKIASSLIASMLLNEVIPEQIGSYLSSRWPMHKTQLFSYMFGHISIAIFWGRGIYWYGIRDKEENADLLSLKLMTFNYICGCIRGYGDRRFLTFKSETCFTLTKCSICMDEKLSTSLCGQVNQTDFLIRIPEHEVVIIDFDKLRSTSDGIGHMVCAECKAKWQLSTTGQGCPICRKHLETILIANDIDFGERRTAFFMYMLIRTVYMNLIPPEDLDLDSNTKSVLRRIIRKFPRSDILSLQYYQEYINKDPNKYVNQFDAGMLFGYFGGICVDLDFMLYRRSTMKSGEKAIVTIGLEYLRTYNRALNFDIYSYDVYFSNRVYDLVSGRHMLESRRPNAYLHWQARRSLSSIDEEPEHRIQSRTTGERGSRVLHYGDDSISFSDSDSSDTSTDEMLDDALD